MIHSRLLALTLGSTLAILTPTYAQDSKLDAPLEVEVPAGEGAVEVGDLVRAWARQTGRRAFVTRQVANLKVRLGVGGHTLTRTQLSEALRDHEVLLVETPERVRAMHHRSAQSRIQLSAGKIYTQDQALPTYNTPVTLVYQVKSGAGSTMFANLRGLMSRDSLRLGNVLYIQGPERIVITDLAPKVAYYREVMRKLDVALIPRQPSQHVTVYEVPHQIWSRLVRAPERKAAADLGKLAEEGKLLTLDAARVNGFTFALTREIRDAKGGRLDLDLRLYVPTPGKTPSMTPPTPLLALNLSRSGPDDQRQARRLQVEAPDPSRTTIVSAKLDSGSTATHLVVVLSPTP